MTEHSEDLIEHYSERLLRTSGYAGEGFAAGYDSHRPSPPAALLDVLCLEAQAERPRLVVDFGSGTGLSTRAWAERADEIVGVEASPEMREQAEAATSAGNVRFVQAFAQETGLEDGVADIVTCSQSFHWMEPESTLAEAARILRPGGVFAGYDYDWPPVVHWEVEAAFEEMVKRVGMRRALKGQPRHTKDGHLDRIRDSGHFRYAREIALHSRDQGSAARIVGMALSLGPLTVLLNEGVSEDEVGLAALREAAASALGEREVDMFLCYRVRLGVR
ncbi:MAG TPA: class I SAM-dependent methyltransferase [Gaiellaceae bacterium]|nr:class I SAM-dependent methyltransferase [Gaiellaceae bacterium]